tara:strand:- start:437 stop:2440 length:2004 start_codon:yes stop_codon:yes gene_type:complete
MSYKRGGGQRSRSATLPAPMQGVNAISPLANMPPDECIFATNILPEDFGCEVRDGYVEWANGWTGGPARTVITFEGNTNAENRLWVANDEGIWEVTVKGTTAPTQVLTWPSSANNAGICSYVNYTNDGLDRFVLLCDGENGYYVWEQDTNLWTQGSFSGGAADVTLLDFVMIWKERVWFVQRNSTLAWYLPVAQFSGVPEQFNFGSQFRFGGKLVSLHNWTLDGGAGLDDYLVALSSAGDVIIFQGTDPTDVTTFGLVGSWYVGEVPAGNRVASEFSGELYILSVQGLLPMSQVLNGAGSENPSTYVTNKIAPYLRAVMDDTLTDFGWQIHIHPKQSLLFINSPPRFARGQLAFTLYFGTLAWGTTRGLTKSHTANWNGEIYWTDITRNKVFIQQGNVDEVYLDPAVDGPPEAIEWNLLSAYSSLDAPAMFKRVQYIRPMFVGSGTPIYEVRAQYDFDVSELPGAPAFTGSSSAVWSDGGVYTHSLLADAADDVYMSFTDGSDQLGASTVIDITLTGHPSFSLTWNPTTERYEGNSTGVYAFINATLGVAVGLSIDPAGLPNGAYNFVPAAVGVYVGFTVPTVADTTPPTFVDNGVLSPSFIEGTDFSNLSQGLWNISDWDGGIQATVSPSGGSGLGRWCAVNISGRSADSVTLVGFDIVFDSGGMM